jgi:PAS domain S-box-containing protein
VGKEDKKRLIISLRWSVIIVTSYLILFGRGKVTDPNFSYVLIVGYILSNIFLSFLPHSWFSHPKFFYSLVIIDTILISLGMYVSEKMITDFYIVFFLIIIFASMSRNFKLLMIIGGFTSILYGFLLYSWGLLLLPESGSYFLRIPFLFIMTAFYGYIVQTLTREKRQELTLSEDKYRGLFENSNDGIIILKASSLEILDINKGAGNSLGYSKEELFGKEVSILFCPEENEKFKNYFERVMGEGEFREEDLSLRKKDGSCIEVDLSTKRIDLGDASFYQMIFRDLTPQRRLEKKIRESKRDLEAIFDGILDQLSIQSPDYRILRVNRAVIKHYSTTFEDLLGRKCYEAYYHREQPCEKCPLTQTLETKKPASSILKSPDSENTYQIYSYPILDEKGGLISVIEYIKDITEQQRLQDQLIQSEKLAGIGILASGIAHEINNPLSGIIGMAELVLEEEGESFKSKEYLKDILACGKRISEIVNGLRSYSRTAKREEYTEVDFNEILEMSLKMVQLIVKSSYAEVVKEFQPLPKIEANAGEIQQIFTNLITNAFQAMDGRRGKITLVTRALKDSVLIQVSDNGVGIPPKYLNKIFDPFFTTKKVGEGTGLGLNIVYRLVTKYGGTIQVNSKEGVGTTFTIQFPIRRAYP